MTLASIGRWIRLWVNLIRALPCIAARRSTFCGTRRQRLQLTEIPARLVLSKVVTASGTVPR
jgi:hypothetical protein